MGEFILPPMWDGHRVEWRDQRLALEPHICPPPPPRACSNCGTNRPPLMWIGLRHPLPGETFESTKRKTGRWGTQLDVPVQVPAWPVLDLFAFRCPECPLDEVWDMRTNEWWELEPEDYGPEGSQHPDLPRLTP